MAKYRPDHKGMQELANAAFVQDAAVDAARRIAATATRLDRSSRADYSTTPALVTGGRDNKKRGGAIVSDAAGTGALDETLRSAIEIETEAR